MTNRLALFDCDGTLVDSQANICTAMERAFASHDLPPPDHHATRRVVGLSLTQAVRGLIPHEPEALILSVADSYKKAFFDSRAAGEVVEPLYDGITELLAALRADGWMLGVATGKSDRGLAHCLASHGITDHFVTLQTADRHPSKPDPAMALAAMAEARAAPETTVMIGDTTFDIHMGVAAGARTIGVDWGYHDAHELHDAGAEAVAMTMDELHRYLMP
ncbi:MAG: HAD-IA family hydrolase [Parasphingorhabdus sp.]|nr:HAD-IA family hydrolase [Parasphingorhabdus sp.]